MEGFEDDDSSQGYIPSSPPSQDGGYHYQVYVVYELAIVLLYVFFVVY